jgi:hypothetical protein
VKAAAYRTPDSPEKVLAFYKKALRTFGSAIQCTNDRPVGIPTHTDEGLTCDKDSSHTGSGEGAELQLKTGSEKHQHIVDINPDNGGTKFGLVSLDLPLDHHSGPGDKDDRAEHMQ